MYDIRSELSNEYYSEYLYYFYIFYNTISILSTNDINVAKRVMNVQNQKIDIVNIKSETEQSILEQTDKQSSNRKDLMKYVLLFTKDYLSIIYTEKSVFPFENDFQDFKTMLENINDCNDLNSTEEIVYNYMKKWLKPFRINL
jgi:hypothetical protein